jgi:hypothetical protein
MGKLKAGKATVSSFAELHKRFSEYRGSSEQRDYWIFRGHSDVSWRLVPKAGRHPFKGHEAVLFDNWKRRAVEYLAPRPQTDWEWLAIAQHHGLATRLLDWTTNPLNAAYFAVRELAKGSAVVFAAKFAPGLDGSVHLGGGDPMKCAGISIYKPSGIVPRIVRQGGLFTIHDPRESSLEDLREGMVTLDRIVIAKEYRPRLLAELAYYGINSASLFPDLDGLSDFLNWTVAPGGSLD